MPFTLFLLALFGFWKGGFWVWLPLLYAFGLIPLTELLLPPKVTNLTAAEEEMAKQDPVYDWILYAIVPFQYIALALFLTLIAQGKLNGMSLIGAIIGMGILCGTFGINVAHELGHRTKQHEIFFAKLLLLTSLYLHFYIEHNKGHHKRVATHEDPASARWGENVYFFHWRSIVFSYLSAWEIANKDICKKGYSKWHWKNEMMQFTFLQFAFCACIGLFWGTKAFIAFLLAALIGILLLETVNYIEHYGLQRKALGNGKYERPLPIHSWNSNHVLGRLLLFELSRHSDHHYLASRKYQILRHFDEAPQMPTGYPGMIVLSLIPPLWFAVIHKHFYKYHPKMA